MCRTRRTENIRTVADRADYRPIAGAELDAERCPQPPSKAARRRAVKIGAGLAELGLQRREIVLIDTDGLAVLDLVDAVRNPGRIERFVVADLVRNRPPIGALLVVHLGPALR